MSKKSLAPVHAIPSRALAIESNAAPAATLIVSSEAATNRFETLIEPKQVGQDADGNPVYADGMAVDVSGLAGYFAALSIESLLRIDRLKFDGAFDSTAWLTVSQYFLAISPERSSDVQTDSEKMTGSKPGSKPAERQYRKLAMPDLRRKETPHRAACLLKAKEAASNALNSKLFPTKE